jgi:hypothetical protein
MKKILLASFLLIFVACNSETARENSTDTSSINNPAVDTIAAITADTIKSVTKTAADSLPPNTVNFDAPRKKTDSVTR